MFFHNPQVRWYHSFCSLIKIFVKRFDSNLEVFVGKKLDSTFVSVSIILVYSVQQDTCPKATLYQLSHECACKIYVRSVCLSLKIINGIQTLEHVSVIKANLKSKHRLRSITQVSVDYVVDTRTWVDGVFGSNTLMSQYIWDWRYSIGHFLRVWLDTVFRYRVTYITLCRRKIVNIQNVFIITLKRLSRTLLQLNFVQYSHLHVGLYDCSKELQKEKMDLQISPCN